MPKEVSVVIPKHYWRIHNRVARRMLLDMSEAQRHVIANDTLHETPEYRAFEKKLNEDATRLFEDPSYYDNQDFTFKVAKYEDVSVEERPQPRPRKKG